MVRIDSITSLTVTHDIIPEPSTFTLALLAALGLSFYRRRVFSAPLILEMF